MLIWTSGAVVELADSLGVTVDEVFDGDRRFTITQIAVQEETDTEGRA